MKTLLVITIINIYSPKLVSTSHELASERDCYAAKESLIAQTTGIVGLTTIASCIEKD